MQNEIVSQAHVLPPGVEVSFGTLSSPHALAAVLVNAQGDTHATGSLWRLYEVTGAGAALIWTGKLSDPLNGAQRLTPNEGVATSTVVELRALNTGSFATVAVSASLVGYDTGCCDNASNTSRSDYVIVGYGTGGAPLAKYLTDAGYASVTVLEIGDNHRDDPVVQELGGSNPLLTYDNQYHIAYTANFANLVDPLNSITLYQDGRMWGGSSGHNYGLAVRGAPATYDAWAAETGSARWAYNAILPVMLALENFSALGAYVPNPAQRGSTGPLLLTQLNSYDAANPFLAAVGTGANSPPVNDYNDPTTGVCVTSTGNQAYSTHDAENPTRTYSVTAFATSAIVDDQGFGVGGRPLTVKSGAVVDKVLFSGTRAIGVTYVQDGVSKTAYADTKVILCAGSIANAAILQRSGLGDAAMLTALGIPVLVDNANVGANMQNHYGPSAMIPADLDNPPPFDAIVTFSDLSGDNLGPPTGVREYQFLMFPNFGGGEPAATQALGLDGVFNVNVAGWNIRPNKLGTVQITTTDPTVEPEVTFNFFGESPEDPNTDLDRAIKFYSVCQNISQAYTGAPLLYPPQSFFPPPYGPAADDSALQECATLAFSVTNHNSGTCRMGASAADAVVDGNLDVFGVTGLSVADNSAVPEINTGNVAYTAYLMGMVKAKIEGAPTPF